MRIKENSYRKHIIKIDLGDCAPNNIKYVTLDLQGEQVVNTHSLESLPRNIGQHSVLHDHRKHVSCFAHL